MSNINKHQQELKQSHGIRKMICNMQKGFSFIALIILIIVLVSIGVIGAILYTSNFKGNGYVQTGKTVDSTPDSRPIIPKQVGDQQLTLRIKTRPVKGEPKITHWYYEELKLSSRVQDPILQAKADQEINFVTQVLGRLPIVGNPLVTILPPTQGALDRLGTYNVSPNQLVLHIDKISPQIEHVILHEMGGHYLDGEYNKENLAQFLGQETMTQIVEAEKELLNQIRKYDQNPNMSASDTLEEKLRSGTPVTLDEITEAANVYPADIWKNPESYLQFREKVIENEVRKRADKELYAEFTAYLLRSQNENLLKDQYQHPVLQILSSVM